MRSNTHSRLGEIVTAADGSLSLRFERQLAHPPEIVWAALTEPAQLAQWFMPGTVEPRCGGRVQLDSGEEGGTVGEVLSWDPPRLLTYSWVREGGTGARSLVRWQLHPQGADGNGTLLILEHSGVDRETAYDYGAGWHDFLDRLTHHLAGEDTHDSTGEYEQLLVQYRALA